MNKEEKKVLEEMYHRYLRENPADLHKQGTVEHTDFQHPDAKKHQLVSFIKSGIRLFGYVLLPVDITFAMVVLLISEMVGIIEELV